MQLDSSNAEFPKLSLDQILYSNAALVMSALGLTCKMASFTYPSDANSPNEFWYSTVRPFPTNRDGMEWRCVPGLLQFTLRMTDTLCEQCIGHVADDILENLSYRRFDAKPSGYVEIDLLKAQSILHYNEQITIVDGSFHFYFPLSA
jgi:hypothetical protein